MSSVNCASRDSLPSFAEFIKNVHRRDVDQSGHRGHPPGAPSEQPNSNLGSELSMQSGFRFTNHSRTESEPKHLTAPSGSFHRGVSSFPGQPNQGGAMPRYGNMQEANYFTFGSHQSPHSASGSYPADYQFPSSGAPQTQQSVQQNSQQVQIVQPMQPIEAQNIQGAQNAQLIWQDLQKLSGYVTEISNGIEVVKYIKDSTISRSEVQAPSLESIQRMLLSIPVSTFSNLEFYTRECHKVCEQLRVAQGQLIRNKEKDIYSSYASPTSPTTQMGVDVGPSQAASRAQGRQRFQSTGAINTPTKRTKGPQKFKSDSFVSSSEPRKTPSPKKRGQSSRGSIMKFDSSREKAPSPSNCNHCGSDKTPEWRRGPDGEKTLCNACGIFYSKLIKKFHSPTEAAKIMQERKSQGLQTDRHV